MDGPRSVTIASDHCVQAGLMATLALLQGKQAKQFLIEQEVTYWCYW
jgi:thiamine biosynthesis lipoprotein